MSAHHERTQFLHRVGDWFRIPTHCRRWGGKVAWCMAVAQSTETKTFLRINVCLRPIATRNQEIFGQKLADYAVDRLWILVIVMQ